jgi:hypothetical protein
MALLDTLLNIGANAMAATATHISLHTADPGTTGLNPATSARLPAGWAAAVNGDLTIANKAFIGGTANGPCTYLGFWNALTAGTFYGSVALTGDTSFNSAGEYTITTLTINGSST